MIKPRLSLGRCVGTAISGAIIQCFCCFRLLGTATIGVEDRQKITPEDDKRRDASALVKLRDRRKRGLLAEAFDIGAGPPFHAASELFEVDIRCEGYAPAA